MLAIDAEKLSCIEVIDPGKRFQSYGVHLINEYGYIFVQCANVNFVTVIYV